MPSTNLRDISVQIKIFTLKKLVFDLLPYKKEKLFTVGRLDKDSEGLILVSNDGELCEKLTHPRYSIEKKYRIHIKGKILKTQLLELQTNSIKIQGIKYNIKHIQFKKTHFWRRSF